MDIKRHDAYLLGMLCNASIFLDTVLLVDKDNTVPDAMREYCEDILLMMGGTTLGWYEEEGKESMAFIAGSITVVCEALVQGRALTQKELDNYVEATGQFANLAEYMNVLDDPDSRTIN